MSNTFAIPITAPPPVDVVLAGIDRATLGARDDVPASGVWPQGPVHLHVRGRSTRSTEVEIIDGEFSVRVVMFASEEDWRLARTIALNVARYADVEIDAESFGTVHADDFEEQVPIDWWRSQALSGIRSIAALIADGRGPITVPGANRSFHVGPRLLSELGTGDDDDTVDRWVETIRRVQWFGDGDRTVFGSVFLSENAAGEEIRLAIWVPADAWACPAVEWVALSGIDSTDDVFLVPESSIETLAEGRWTWLDEKQRLITGFDEAAWEDLRQRARPYAQRP